MTFVPLRHALGEKGTGDVMRETTQGVFPDVRVGGEETGYHFPAKRLPEDIAGQVYFQHFHERKLIVFAIGTRHSNIR